MDIYNIFHKITPAILFDLHQEIDRPVKNEHLRQKTLFQFSHCELSIYLWQHPSITSLWRIYLTIDTILWVLA